MCGVCRGSEGRYGRISCSSSQLSHVTTNSGQSPSTNHLQPKWDGSHRVLSHRQAVGLYTVAAGRCGDFHVNCYSISIIWKYRYCRLQRDEKGVALSEMVLEIGPAKDQRLVFVEPS